MMQRSKYYGCQPVKMKINFLFISLLLASFVSCKKETEIIGSGTVIAQGGCYADTWLVAIDNPDFSKQPFLRSTVLTCTACYNCSNAVFIHLLPPSLAVAGTRIKFSYIDKEGSCLSNSEAPDHITVKNLSRL
jgi:hypothetical protein